MDLMTRRRVMLAAGKPPRLPRAYQEVEYLESTGTQRINTHLYADQNFSINLTFQVVVASGSQMFFGARDDGAGAYANSFIGGLANAGYFWGQFGKNGTTLGEAPPDTEKHVFFMSRDGWYLDAVLLRTFGQSAFRGIYPMLVFAGHNGDTITYSHCRVFGLLLSSADVPILDLIPCYRKSDHKPGMYDLVTKAFFTNSGTGEFLVGADVSRKERT